MPLTNSDEPSMPSKTSKPARAPEATRLLILVYTRRPNVLPSNSPLPSIFRHLQGLAIYENHVRWMIMQLRLQYPTATLLRLNADLEFSVPAMEARVRACFGGSVSELRFQGSGGGRCLGEGRVLRALVRGYKIVLP
jgi:hypothetical protein